MNKDINKFVGIPFVFGYDGYDKCDCIGLCRLFYHEQGWNNAFGDGLPVESDTDPKVWRRLFRYLHKEFNRVKDVKDLQYGDVVLFEIGGSVHLGIYLEYGKLLAMQVPTCTGETTSTIYHRNWWQRLFKAGYRRKQ